MSLILAMLIWLGVHQDPHRQERFQAKCVEVGFTQQQCRFFHEGADYTP